MYTSAIDSLKTGMKYLAASILIAAAAAVYGLFGHGVYSYFMTYAFMIPLLAGALSYLITAMKRSGDAAEGSGDAQETAAEIEMQTDSAKLSVLREAQLAMVATLTAGSLLKGVLDIYGTTNRLLIAYPVIAVLIMAAALTVAVKRSGKIPALLKNK